MPDCPGKEGRREDLSIPLAGGWTQTGQKLKTQGTMSCPGSDAWAILWSLKKEEMLCTVVTENVKRKRNGAISMSKPV